MKHSALWRAAIAACAFLAGCARPPMVMGVVDPELIVGAPETASAQTCTLKRRASLPVTMAGLPMVTAIVNGRPARLILDTGAETSIVSVTAAKRLGVTSKYDFARSMRGIGQAMQTGDARLESMSLGGAALSYPRVLVGPIALNIGGVEADGLLGASLLSEFDLDIDLPNRRLELYDRLDCPTITPPWSGRFTALETTRSLSSHPFFPMEVNGRTLTASLDTGAQRTVIAAAAARKAGIGVGTRISEISARGAAGETLPAEMHAVRGIRIGDVPVQTPVMISPVTLPFDIDALLGADFLQTHRIWLSYGSRRLFVSN